MITNHYISVKEFVTNKARLHDKLSKMIIKWHKTCLAKLANIWAGERIWVNDKIGKPFG